jgi:hypothetical protein
MLGYRLLREANPPLVLALLHGAAAATGLVLLTVAVVGRGKGGPAIAALVLFGCVAVAGVALFWIDHVRHRLLRKQPILVKGLLALTALVFLVLAVMGE